MATLYELTKGFIELLSLAEQEDVDPEVLADTMEGLEGEFEEKADGYKIVMLELEAEEDKLDKEIKRLTARKKAIATNKKRIGEFLFKSMLITGKKNFKTTKFNFAIRKNPPSLKIDDESAVPLNFMKMPAPQIDKKEIIAKLKEGAEFTWCHMEQTERLDIR